MTQAQTLAEFVRQGVPKDAAVLLLREAATLELLVQRGLLSEASSRRQAVRFARWLGRGRA